MNKKILIICLVAALVLSVICLSACNKDKEYAETLRGITTAMQVHYSKVELNVKTHTDEIDLNARYVMTKSGVNTDISYEVERLNSFAADGTAPSDLVSIISGTAVFNGSGITHIDGEALDKITLLDIADISMTFRMSYFEIINASESGMLARVINPKGFLKKDEFEGTNMVVRVTMNESDLSSIVITYDLDGANVTLEYAFTR